MCPAKNKKKKYWLKYYVRFVFLKAQASMPASRADTRTVHTWRFLVTSVLFAVYMKVPGSKLRKKL